MKSVVAALYRYPVKGFTPEPLKETALTFGQGIAFDRAYAVEDGHRGSIPQRLAMCRR